jgi:hypothetical protein
MISKYYYTLNKWRFHQIIQLGEDQDMFDISTFFYRSTNRQKKAENLVYWESIEKKFKYYIGLTEFVCLRQHSIASISVIILENKFVVLFGRHLCIINTISANKIIIITIRGKQISIIVKVNMAS